MKFSFPIRYNFFVELGQQVLYLGKGGRTLRFRVVDSIRTRSSETGRTGADPSLYFGPNGQEVLEGGVQVNPSVLPLGVSRGRWTSKSVCLFHLHVVNLGCVRHD